MRAASGRRHHRRSLNTDGGRPPPRAGLREGRGSRRATVPARRMCAAATAAPGRGLCDERPLGMRVGDARTTLGMPRAEAAHSRGALTRVRFAALACASPGPLWTSRAAAHAELELGQLRVRHDIDAIGQALAALDDGFGLRRSAGAAGAGRRARCVAGARAGAAEAERHLVLDAFCFQLEDGALGYRREAPHAMQLHADAVLEDVGRLPVLW